MKINTILLWFAVIIVLAIAINNLIGIRELLKIMKTMIETDQYIIDLLDYRSFILMI